jgi:cyanophycinase
MRTSGDAAAEARLMQRFWNEAGAYGSRIVVLAVGTSTQEEADRLARLFELWESERVVRMNAPTRAAARAWGAAENAANATEIERATAILVLNDDAAAGASLIGGTALAQSLRRANARNKALAAVGSGAALLCQHMGAAPARSGVKAGGHAIGFAPGLGAVNRVLLDCTAEDAEQVRAPLTQAVCVNPFLVGVGLGAASGAVVYPNATLEAFGDGRVVVVDGSAMEEVPDAATLEGESAEALAARGIAVHGLTAGCIFRIEERTLTTPQDDDLSLQSSAYKAAF